MSIILFFLVLFVLILVHEWGHYIVAKKTGMRVDEFAIGFPPRLFVIKKGETEYTFNLLPIGGFVRIYGENPLTSGETLDEPRSFAAKSKSAQALVLLAGVTMNVIFAWLLFASTFMIGVPTAVDESEASANASLYISDVLPESTLSGIVPAGARIITLKTEEETLYKLTPSEFSQFVQDNGGNELSLTYKYSGEEKTIKVTPSAGVLSSDKNKVAIGVSLALVDNVKESPVGAIKSASLATMNGLTDISVGLFTLLKKAVQGTADFSQVAGPVGIVGLVGDAASYGVTALLTFTAMISLNLAVINLLPIPALDGGRLLFVFIEAVIRRPIAPVWTTRLNLLGFLLLMTLMVVVTWHDVARLF